MPVESVPTGFKSAGKQPEHTICYALAERVGCNLCTASHKGSTCLPVSFYTLVLKAGQATQHDLLAGWHNSNVLNVLAFNAIDTLPPALLEL